MVMLFVCLLVCLFVGRGHDLFVFVDGVPVENSCHALIDHESYVEYKQKHSQTNLNRWCLQALSTNKNSTNKNQKN